MNPVTSYGVYVACPLPHASEAQEIARELRAANFEVCSTWHDRQDSDPLFQNLVGLATADVLVALTWPGAGRETYVEIGRALAKQIPIVWFPQNRADGTGGCLSLEKSRLVLEVTTQSNMVDTLNALRREKIASRLGDGAFEV